MRIGFGYDVHKLVAGRRLVLGGVDVPFERGLLGHSDADVLCHAVIDALLGAAKKGDIGRLYPDTDAAFEGISSLSLLESAAHIIYDDGYFIENIDCVICAQKPKLAPFFAEMEQNLARCLNVSPDRISVKATTEEGLGFTGTGEGISARAVCLIDNRKEPIYLRA